MLKGPTRNVKLERSSGLEYSDGGVSGGRLCPTNFMSSTTTDEANEFIGEKNSERNTCSQSFCNKTWSDLQGRPWLDARGLLLPCSDTATFLSQCLGGRDAYLFNAQSIASAARISSFFWRSE